MPDDPGTLQRAAAIIKKYDGNINRIQFDRRIDPCTVFFEVTATEDFYDQITRNLAALGYLTGRVPSANFSSLQHLPVPTSRLLISMMRAGIRTG